MRLLPVVALIAVALPLVLADPTPAAAQPLTIEQERRYFTEDAVAPMVRPPDYDVTIVEYLDYQCPHCRTSHRALRQLLAKDKRVRVIFRDWPVFGEASVDAAIAALGSKYQGKYPAMHAALMESPVPLDAAKIRAAARTAGVDWARLQKDMETHSAEIFDLLARHEHQASLLGLQGTPAFIIGNEQSFGGMSLKELEASVAKARAESRQASAADPGPAAAEQPLIESGSPRVPAPADRQGDNRAAADVSGAVVQQGQSRLGPAWLTITAALLLAALLAGIGWVWRRRRA